MEIDCKLYGPPRDTLGQKEVTVSVSECATVEDALAVLVNQDTELEHLLFTDGGEISEAIAVLVNQINISGLNGLETLLESDDEILVMPPIHGG